MAENTVDLLNLVEAKVMASTRLTKDAQANAVGEYFYPLLRASFERQHRGVQMVIQEDVGVGVALHTGDDDPIGDRLDTQVLRKTLRFDWTVPRELLGEAHALADEGRRWIRNQSERRDLLALLFSITSQIQATIARENRQCPDDQDERGKPTERIEHDVNIIRSQIVKARDQFQRDIERAAQFRYARGIAIGAAAMAALCGVIAGVLAVEHVKVVNAVGLAAGAVGACVSVLQRMTKGTLDLNAQAGHKMILAFGALRPFVGGIFGFVIYLVIRAELISIFVLPKEATTALAYVAVFAFVAGFNERFFQDVLANASNSRSED